MKISLGQACLSIVDCEHKSSPIDVDGDFFAVGTPAMGGNIVDYSQARRISKETFIEWTRRLTPRYGDLLLAREAPVGPVVRIPKNENVAPGQRTVLLRPDPTIVDSEYLYFYLVSPRTQGLLHVKAGGSTVAHLNVADIRSLEVDAPELAEQRAIAEVLGALDDKIAANTKLALTAAALISSMWEKLQFEIVETRRLQDLVSTQYGLTASATTSPGPKFLRVTDINKKPWVEWSTTPNCELSDGDLEKYALRPDDILVARMADPGKAAMISEGDPIAVFASYLVRLRSHDSHLAHYIYYFLRSQIYRDYAEGAMQGTVQMNMNAKVIVATDIGLPSEQAISSFTSSARALRPVIAARLKENVTLAALRDTLLPQLMSGALRVRDAEKTVGEVV